MRLYAAEPEPTRKVSNPLARFDLFDLDGTVWLTMRRRVLGRRSRAALDLTRLFALPGNHPDRIVAASIVLYIRLGIIIAITVRSHLKAAHP
jgi:hypothetical protein